MSVSSTNLSQDLRSLNRESVRPNSWDTQRHFSRFLLLQLSNVVLKVMPSLGNE